MTNVSLNSTRLLSQQKIPFKVYEFPDTIHNALEVAQFVGLPPEQVFKTLVVLKRQPKAKPMLIMIPAPATLNLKGVAAQIKEKKVQMASHTQAEALTGLKVGGISALALLNKGFVIYLDQSARQFKTILISAGQRGINLELAVTDLQKITNARWINAL